MPSTRADGVRRSGAVGPGRLRGPAPVVAGAVGALTLAAWLGLWGWQSGPHGRYVSHDGLAGSTLSPPVVIAVFLGGWALMLTAMMLPTVYPLVRIFAGVVHARPDRVRLQLALLGGYLLVWVGAGLVALLGDLVLHEAVDRAGWLAERPWVIGAGVLAAAGGYQFSPLKDRCLTACRSPRMFIFSRWHGRRPVSDAVNLGMAHGRYCLGCCAALMLVMFAIGMGNLGVMFALAAVMTIEKTVSWGRRLTAPTGIALLAAAAVATAHGLL